MSTDGLLGTEEVRVLLCVTIGTHASKVMLLYCRRMSIANSDHHTSARAWQGKARQGKGKQDNYEVLLAPCSFVLTVLP